MMQEIIKYQEIDSKLRKLENELNSSSNRKNASDMQRYLKDGQAKLIRLEGVAQNLTEQYQKAIKLYNEFVGKLETLSKSVDEANSGNVEELRATVNNFMNTANTLENNINVLASRIASANKEFESLMNNAKKAKHNLDIYKANFGKEKERLDPEISKLKNELAKQRAKVDPAVLAKYNAKADGKLFPIFVAETKGRCGGCHMEIPAGKLSDLKKKKVIECENCGRFIYIKD